MKPIEVGYYTGRKTRYGKKHVIILFYEVRHDGTVKTVDISRREVKYNKTFGGEPVTVKPTTQSEFNRALNYVLNQ